MQLFLLVKSFILIQNRFTYSLNGKLVQQVYFLFQQIIIYHYRLFFVNRLDTMFYELLWMIKHQMTKYKGDDHEILNKLFQESLSKKSISMIDHVAPIWSDIAYMRHRNFE